MNGRLLQLSVPDDLGVPYSCMRCLRSGSIRFFPVGRFLGRAIGRGDGSPV